MRDKSNESFEILSKRKKQALILQWGGLFALFFGLGLYTLLISPSLPHKNTLNAALPVTTPLPVLAVPSHSAKQKASPVDGLSNKSVSMPSVANEKRMAKAHKEDLKPHRITVKKGDSLAVIFSRLGLSAALLDKIMRLGNAVNSLKHLVPGDIITFEITQGHALHALYYDVDDFSTLEIRRKAQGTGYEAKRVKHPIEKRLETAQGIVKQSLFQATTKAGVPIKVAYKMADIFGWDIDFARDLRAGDAFFVSYEVLYKYGKKMAVGEIVAAAFENNGNVYRALRYRNTKGETDYYDAEGRTLRKSFLRTPVEYKRISSRFSLKRKHPVLNRIRAHKGVDYAAPRGTPVKATGDGVIEFLGRNGGYGRVIRIKHGQTYTTVYAHLNKYRKGMKKGRHVKQGQTIAYVGSSGLATGPHLHYEFRVNGVHRNPLKVKFPKSKPVPKNERSRFLNDTQTMRENITQWLGAH